MNSVYSVNSMNSVDSVKSEAAFLMVLFSPIISIDDYIFFPVLLISQTVQLQNRPIFMTSYKKLNCSLKES